MLSFTLSPEQQMLVETARRFAREEILPRAVECDRESKFPHDVYGKAHEIGLVVPEVPPEYGGAGMGVLDNCLIIEELNWACSGIATSIAATSLAAAPLILGGSEDQKKKYLGMVAREGAYASYATTEPEAGSDVAGLRTRATRHGDGWVLNGEKCFITNASFAKWIAVFATVDPTKRHKGIMAFIVPTDRPGVRVGKKEDKLGQRASDTATVHFEEVELGAEHVLAPEGHGFKLAMQTFDRTRPWIGAGAVGIMRRCLDESRTYALDRKTFGVPIAQHQAIQFMLAEMAMKIEATRLLVHKAAWQLDNEPNPTSLVSSISKAFGADSAMQVAVDAVQVFGGNGFMKDYPVEKLMRDAKILQIYEGTSQIQRMVIARQILGV